MCQQLTVLAQDSAGHTIAQCEHGTIHLYWQQAALFVQPHDLLALLALLQCWQPTQTRVQSQDFVVQRMPDGWLQLWSARAGMLLSEVELYALLHLLWQAAGRLDLLGTACRHTPHRADEYRVFTAVETAACSCN